MKTRNPLFPQVLFILAFWSLPLAAKPVLLSSINPIHLLVTEIAGDRAEAKLLLPASVSPHLYQLRPSDRLLLDQADRVFWVGPDLELFLSKPLALLPEHKVIRFIESEHAFDQRSHKGHAHEDHPDAHIWLDPLTALEMARKISHELALIDPEGKVIYFNNLAILEEKIQRLHKRLQKHLASAHYNPYMVLHDAYNHFESRYGVKHTVAFSLSPEMKPGARHLIHLQKLMEQGQIQCLFYEPQYSPKVLKTLLAGRRVMTEELDPLALGAVDYTGFIEHFARAFQRCTALIGSRS